MRSEDPSTVARLASFSDIVFGIALTLLVLHVPIPASYVTSDVLHDSLGDVVPELIGYGISFIVIAVLWADHHRLFEHLARRDEPLLWMNLGFLLCVAFLPYPAGVFTKHMGAPVAVLFFAGSLVVTAMAGAVVAWHATRGADLPADRTDGTTRQVLLLRPLSTAAVFAVSMPAVLVGFHVGEVKLTLAQVLWLCGLVAARIFLVRRAHAGAEPKAPSSA
jgi:uncharacterized membrane protein